MSTHDSKTVADETAPPGTADPPTSSSMPTWFPRALRLTIGYVLGTLALLWFFNQARDLLGLALLAALFSLALESAVNQLHRRGWSRGAATATLLVGAMGFFLILGLMVIPIMVKNLGRIADDVPGWIDDVNEYTQREFDVQLIPNRPSTPPSRASTPRRTSCPITAVPWSAPWGGSWAPSSPCSRSPCSSST